MDAYIGGAWASPSSAEAFISGSWRQIQYGEAYISGAWRTIANFTPPSPPPPSGGGGGGGGGGSMTLSISPSPFSKSSLSYSINSGQLTATPSGGLAPYTYSWIVVSSDEPVTINSPSLASTSATMTMGFAGEVATCILRCTATDSLGVTASADVNGTFHNIAS